MKLKIYILFLCSLFLYSCYEDKGNYDYASIDEVDISFDLASYSVPIGEDIEIKPTLMFKNPADSVNFSYEWRIGGEPYSTERNLKYTGEVLGTNFVMFSVINNRTKVRTIQEIIVQVSSPYNIAFAPSWFVLSNDGGKSVLHMITSKYVDGEYQYVDRRDIYNNHGEELGSDPVKLVYHAPSGSYELLVIQRGGQKSVELDVNSMSRVIRNDEEFFNEQPPVGFVPKDAYYGMYADVLLGEDGNLYSRAIANYGQLHQDPFNNNPMLLDPKKDSRIGQIVSTPAFANEVLLYDELNNRLLCLGTDFRSGGDVQEMPTVSYPAAYTPLNDMGNKELVHLSVGEPMMNFNMIVKNPDDGKYYFQRFMLMYMAYNNTFMLSVGQNHKELKCSSYFTSQTQMAIFRTGKYIFFSGGASNNQLYRYDTSTDITVLVKEFEDQSIQLLRLPNVMQDESTLGVVFTNGDVVSLNMSSANINANIYEELFRYNFGKVVDVVAK